jgi:hypothetical protein
MGPWATSITLFFFSLIATCYRFVMLRGNPFVFAFDIDRLYSQVGDSLSQTINRQSGCKVIVLNQEHNYHYEVLESILAMFPLPPRMTCNLTNTSFTFVIADGHEKDFYHVRSESWYNYATQVMISKSYSAIEGQYRFLSSVIRSSSIHDVRGFDYEIRASCYCRSEVDRDWLFQNESRFCIFHEVCNNSISHSPRVIGLNPQFNNSFFPSLLPTFNQTRSVDQLTHHLCIVGEGKRREYSLLSEYLWNHPFYSGLHFHHFGIGNVQKPMKPFAKDITLHPNPNFTEYQYDLYDTCDAILSLLSRSMHPEYFEGPTKLSGGIVQAAAYRKPILLHEDLAAVYHDYLTHVEVHDDDPDSFSLALSRLLDLLNTMKASKNVTYSDEPNSSFTYA